MFEGRNYGGPRPPGRPRKYLKGHKPAAERNPRDLCVEGCGKYRQGRDGRCYRCRRIFQATIIQQADEALAQLEEEAARKAAENVPPAGQTPPRREIVGRGGVVYEVAWDGT